MKIAIVILNWNGKNDTLECLRSLAQMTYSGKWEVILVDNGSQDGSVPAFRRGFPQAAIIETGENLGFAAGNNVGIKKALSQGADAVVMLNNDTVVSPTFLESLAKMSLQYPNALLGCKIHQYHYPEYLDHLGGVWNPSKANFDLIGKNAPAGEIYNTSFDMDYACGCGLFIPKSVFAAIGYLEPSYFLYWEDSDFCYRAKKAGFPIKFCPEATIWHKGSASSENKKYLPTYFWWRNRMLWMRRNLSKKERKYLYRKAVYPEIRHLCKLLFLKSLSWHLYLKYNKKSSHYARRFMQLMQYKAAAKGCIDYARKKFGSMS